MQSGYDILQSTVSTMTTAASTEGVWKRRLHSRIAQRVIELEEHGLDLTGVVGIDGQKSPEERIYYADIQQERYESGEKWDFTNFFSLPLGLGAGWNVKKEYVDY